MCVYYTHTRRCIKKILFDTQSILLDVNRLSRFYIWGKMYVGIKPGKILFMFKSLTTITKCIFGKKCAYA